MKKQPIRVGVLTSTYARSADDCQVPWMRHLNGELKEEVESLLVMAPSYMGLGDHEIDGVTVKRFRYAPASWETLTHDEGAPSKVRAWKNKVLAVSYLLCGLIAITRWCVQEKITVLHIHWPFPHGLWGVIPKYLLGVRVIAMSHGAELAMARRSPLIRKILSLFLRSADVCCANSSHTAAEVFKVSGCSSKVIPYGATIQDASSKDASPSEGRAPLILFCGRLIQRKGIDILLRALPAVIKRHEVRVVITGEGDCKQEWMNLSAELGLEEVVNFSGFVSNEELSQLYHACDLYVHPALFDDQGDTEGLGVVLIEALMNKKPVIASAVGGIVDVIKDRETGLLVPEKDPKALAEAMIEVLENPELGREIGEQGFSHVEEYFSWERVSRETLAVYERRAHEEKSGKLDWELA